MKTKLLSFLFVILFFSSVFSQDIINTLGTSGNFIIKDGTATFLTVDQNTGYLTLNYSLSLLHTTSPTLGVIYKGADRFIHDYYPIVSDGKNTFAGINAGNFTLSGNFNTSFGNSTLTQNTFGPFNSAFGYNALNANTSGASNSAFGSNSLKLNVVGTNNSAFGSPSLVNNTEGSYNSAFGSNSLFENTAGENNSAFGSGSLQNNQGANNSAFGFIAGGQVVNGSNLTLIGYNAQPSNPDASNEITLGDENVTTLRSNAPSITSLSDARDKKNIEDLELGLDFLMKIKPRQFNWDRRDWYDNSVSDGSKIQTTPTAGFIAQELDAVQTGENADWLNLVLKTNPDKIEATYGNLLPVIVKAIQDLKKENDDLKSENENLQVLNNKLNNRLTKFEEIQTMFAKEIEKLKENKSNVMQVSLEQK